MRNPYSDGIVRAVFLNDPRGTVQGKRYHYKVPGAQIGDLITGPGATGPAEVVAYGRAKNYVGVVKTGSMWEDRTTAHTTASFAGALKDVWSSEGMQAQLDMAHDMNRQVMFPVYAKDTTMNTNDLTPEELRAEADRIEQITAEREAYRIERERDDSTKKRRREGSLAQLENIVHNGKSDQARMQAAQILLRYS